MSKTLTTPINHDEAWIIHDGVIILEVSDGFCDLFLCLRETFIDRRVEEIIASEDLRALARLRGKYIMRSQEDREFMQEYDFLRCDGSRFWGTAYSKRLSDGRYQTRVKWSYDI